MSTTDSDAAVASVIAYNDINHRHTNNWIPCYVIVTLIPFVFIGCAVYSNYKLKREKRAARARLAQNFGSSTTTNAPWRVKREEEERLRTAAAAGQRAANTNTNPKHPPPPEPHHNNPQKAERTSSDDEQEYEMRDLSDSDKNHQYNYPNNEDGKDARLEQQRTSISNAYWKETAVGEDEDVDLERGEGSSKHTSTSSTLTTESRMGGDWWESNKDALGITHNTPR